MTSPKVAIIGAGSLFFGRKAIWQMVHSPALRGGTLALVDTDADRLEKMRRLAQMVIDARGVALRLEASTDARDVLAGSDFVVLSFAHDNARYRGVDCEIAEKYGMRMCSGDTIGPGGVFRTLREWPAIAQTARAVLELCPEAWVINYINPAAVHGIGLRRFFPQLKSLALCDAQYSLTQAYAKALELPDPDRLSLITAGPNHFTWLLEATYDGRDVLPDIIELTRQRGDEDLNQQAQGGNQSAKGWLNNAIGHELYEAFGAVPTVVAHTKEYVRFYQGWNKAGRDTHPPLKIFEVPDRLEWTQRVWDRVDAYLDGTVPISEFDTEFGPDPATDLVEKMWTGKGMPQFVNIENHGAVPNLSDRAFVEVLCDLDMDGPRPRPCPPLPLGVRGLSEQILDAHELTVMAAHHHDRGLVRRALLTDPLAVSIGDVDAAIDELFDAQREALPTAWYES